MLSHGIYAFKLDAAGARTDLVYQESATNDVQRYASGLVLTEWKRANPDSEAGKKFDEAKTQAKKYAQGILAGSELAAFRYVIVVSQQNVTIPQDITENGITYRHINIAVNPQTPSQR